MSPFGGALSSVWRCEPSGKVASVRKSILAVLYGNYIVSGKIDPNRTVEQLGLTDVPPFFPLKRARRFSICLQRVRESLSQLRTKS